MRSARIAKDATADSDVFQNPDGSYTRRVYQGRHNFRASDGSWTPIDTTVSKRVDGRWHEGANSFGVDFATSGADAALTSVSLDGAHTVAFGLQGAANVAASVSGSTLTYAGVQPGVDVSESATSDGVKESLVLHSPDAGSSWVFPLRLQGLSPRVESDRSVSFVDSAGVVRATVPAGSMSDSRPGRPATSQAVTYTVTTVDGGPALVVSVDSTWLRDPARVFPVVVDPTLNTNASSSTFADSALPGDNSASSLLRVGSSNGAAQANSFLQFSSFGATYAGATMTSVVLNLYDVWAGSCTPEPFDVFPVSQVWTPSGVTSYPGPGLGSRIGSVTSSPGAACTNTTLDPNGGAWLGVPLLGATFQSWAQGGDNYGLAVTADSLDATDPNGFKEFASTTSTHAPYLQVTYSGNLPPVVDSQSPGNNATVWTLQPELIASAHDPDHSPSASLYFSFGLYDADNPSVLLASNTSSSSSVWQVPAGKLAVGKNYLWYAQVGDGAVNSAMQVYSFRVEAAAPPITSHLSQNGDNGLEASIGNYTTSATDATVTTVGPALSIQRSYNSKDPRTAEAMGAGWSSVLDAKALERTDAQSSLFSVLVTYPDGQQVAFGRKADGTFAPPQGRYTNFTAATGGGYTLTDKNQTVYSFTTLLSAGVYGITSIADSNGRSVTFGYTSGQVTSMTSSASGRMLHLTWTIPLGAAAPHVASVYTDPAVAGDSSTVQTWTYGYTGDNLTQVCSPVSATACTTYSYQSASRYPNMLLDLGPRSYWRLAESAGTSVAGSQVLANNGADAATYHNVTLGAAGPFPGSSATAGSFDGSSSWVDLTQGGNPAKAAIDNGLYQSISLWFKTSSATAGVLFSYQVDPETNSTTPGNYMPALYVGNDGKLYGELWQGSYALMHSATAVNDNIWHHVVLAGAGNTQTLYLDGSSVGTLAGQIGFPFPNGVQYAYVGAGYLGFKLPAQPHYSDTVLTGYQNSFAGSIADVGFFNTTVDATSIAALSSAGRTASQLLTTVTKPSGNVAASLTYDAVTGRVATLTDGNGGTWTMGTPGVAGSSQVYVNSVLGASPQAYYRLGDATGPTAKDQVKGGDATYSNVTLGVASPFADGTSAASFNGTSSYTALPSNLINAATSMSTSMWFKTTATNGTLLSYVQDPITNNTTSNGYVPALYIGTSGKLHAQFWVPAGATSVVTASAVNDNKWHYVVLSYDKSGSGTQTLYLDGNPIGSITGAVAAGGFPYQYIGAGFLGGSWPDQTWLNQAAHPAYFTGTISDVAYYRYPISQSGVQAQYGASKTANSLITNGGATPVETVNVTDPGGKTITYAYDPGMGNRILSRTDGSGNVTRYGYDGGGFLNTVTDPMGAVTTTGHDVRGNTVSKTTCQNQATNTCSTSYYTFYPDATTTNLTPDARNDVPLTVRDGRSASASDNTYLTSYSYDTKGNRLATTTPPVSGYPSGRATTTTYTDGTVAAADSGFAPAGLPWKVTTPGGALTTTTYFHSGDVATITDPVGLVTSFTYDQLGRPLTQKVVSDTYSAGLTTSLSYDKMNRITVQTFPPVTNRVTGAVHTRQSTTVFDNDGDKTSNTVADLTGGDASRTTSATFNNHGQQVSSTDAANKTTTYGYDAYGNRNKTIDPAGVETDYAFDPDGHLLTTTLRGWTGDPVNPSAPADLVRESRAYDPAGRLAAVTDSMGWVTAYTYTDDGLTATITRSDPAHPGTSFVTESDSYDAAGNLIGKVTNNNATTTSITVDAANRTTATVVDPAGVNRQTTYVYSPDDGVLSTRNSGPSGSSTVDATYDAAGRMTSQTVNNDTASHPGGWWKLNESSGILAADSSGAQQTGTMTSGVTWTGSSSASFTGTGSAITTNGPVLNTQADFSVSAWVNPSSLSGYPVAVSQDAVHNAGFYLEYSSGLGKWVFNRTPTDTNGAGSLYAASNSAGATNTWVHLVGTFNSTNGQLTLYVNGTAQTATGTDTTPIAANGPLAIGRAKYSDVSGQNFAGQIANVQVYPRLLSAADVSTLYGNGRTGAALSTNRLTTTWTLDKRGLPTASTDPNGNTTSYTYDEADQLAVTTAPTVNTETGGGTPTPTHPVSMVGYDTFGAKTETSDPNGNVTTTGYDADARPVSVTLPAYTPPGGSPITATTTTSYNNAGLVDTSTDPLGHSTSYLYDQLGRVAQQTAPNLGATHYTYDTEGDQLSVTDPNGAVNQTTYDYLGRKATTTQVVRQPSTNAYTATYAYTTTGGWLASATSPGNVVTSYGYNNVGETTTVTDGASNVTSYSYDYAGRAVKTVLPDATSSTVTYDAAGRQTATATLDTDGTTKLAGVSAVFDNDGNQTSTTDALGHTSTFTYDALGRLTGEVQPVSASASISTSFGYDPAGNRTRFTDGRANPFVTTYNPWNLPESQIEPSTTAFPNLVDRTFTTTYDADGQVATQTSPGGVSVTNTYDNLGDVTGQTGAGADAVTLARSFGYDAGGRMTSASAPGGTDTFTLDDRGLLLSAAGPSGASSFAYNPDAAMTSRTDASGTTGYTYDTAGRLKTITDASTSAVLTYSYNTLSQPSGITYGASADTRAFGYDHLHRVTSDTLKTSTNATVASISYGYDANDNETSKTATGLTGSAANTYTYDWANRLLSWNNGTATSNYAYDNSGNRTQAGAQTFTYNARNQLLTGAGSTYTYTARGTLASVVTSGTTTASTNDAFGQTITQGTQTYTYDALGRLVTDAAAGAGTRTLTYTSTGNTLAGDGTATYSRDPAGALVGINTGTTGVLAWTDKHTDVIANFTTTASSVTGSTTYTPLGTVAATAGMAGNLGYQSGFTEPSTGRVNMAARWYNPNTGEFDNRDTATLNPLPASVNANQYAYVDDNPLVGTDPTGHCWFGCSIIQAVTHTASAITHTVSAAVSHAQSAAANYLHQQYDNIKADAKAALDLAKQAVQTTVHAVQDAYTKYVPKSIQNSINRGIKAANHFASNVKHAAVNAYHQTLANAKAAVHAANKFYQDHKQIIAVVSGIVAGVGVGLACEALTGGAGSLGCLMAASAAGHLATDAVAGNIHNVGDALKSIGTGAVEGLFARPLAIVDAIGQVGTIINDARKGDWSGAALHTAALGLDAATVAFGGGRRTADEAPRTPSSCVVPHSFASTTPVLMADGTTKPIKDVKIGDKVTSTDPQTGWRYTEPVTQLHKNHDTELTDVTVRAADTTTTLHTTQHHPFWDATQHQWTNAAELALGTQLHTDDGQSATVIAIHNYTGSADMRDLTVDNVHTYYVIAGDEPVLVHNCGNGNNGIGFAPGEGASPLAPDRLQHGTRHLTDAGILPKWKGSTSPQLINDTLAPVLENPRATFNSDLGGTGVRGFVGELPDAQGTMQPVAVMVFSEGPKAGKLATAVVPSPNQMKNWFVG